MYRQEKNHSAATQRKSRIIGIIAGALLVCALLPLAGCSRTPRTITDEWPVPIPTEPLRLQAGDVVEIRFRYSADLDTVQTIRPDGKISLQMLGDVEVSNLSPQEIGDLLTALYQEDLVDPIITVIVQSLNSQRIFVGGEVNTPGVYEMRGRINALQAVMQAGGFNNESAKPTQVVIVRHADGNRYARMLDLHSPLVLAMSDELVLAPNDIVFVPRTRISKLNQFVDQYINRMIPNIGRDIILFTALRD